MVQELVYQDEIWRSESGISSVFARADAPGGPIAAVAWANRVRLYYISGGDIIEGQMNGAGKWSVDHNDASTIGATSSSGGSPTAPPITGNANGPEGLSQSDKIAIGIGLPVGIFSIIGGIAAWCTCCRRRRVVGGE